MFVEKKRNGFDINFCKIGAEGSGKKDTIVQNLTTLGAKLQAVLVTEAHCC
jgi:hypothetical protein